MKIGRWTEEISLRYNEKIPAFLLKLGMHVEEWNKGVPF